LIILYNIQITGAKAYNLQNIEIQKYTISAYRYYTNVSKSNTIFA